MPNQRFSPHERLSDADIKKIYASGVRLKGKYVTLLYIKRPEGEAHNPRCSRIGVAVPKRVAKRAHARNRLKRLIREIYRRNKKLFPLSYDFHFVISTLPDTITYLLFQEEIQSLILRVS